MNQIRRMTKAQLQNLGGSGYTKKELIESVGEIYQKLGATNVDDLRTKVTQFIPFIKIRPNTQSGLKKAIKQKFNIGYLKNGDLPRLTERYNNELATENFEEIVRVANLNDGWLTYENDQGLKVLYRINENNLNDLRTKIAGIQNIELVNGSDQDFFMEITENINNIRGYDINAQNFPFVEEDEENGIIRRQNETGGFLLKGHTLPFDFSRYGLFRADQETKEYHKNNCLYHAFKAGGMSETNLESLKLNFFQRDISISSLKQIAEKLNIQIKLSTFNKKQNLRVYGTNDKEIYTISIIEGHYFINEETKYKSFVIENYEEVKNIKNFMNIVGRTPNGYSKKLTQNINSKKLLELVLKQYSYKINKMDVINTVYHHKIDSKIVNLEYLNSSTREYISNEEKELKKQLNNEIKTEKKKSEILRIFFDFETVASDTNISKRKLKETDNFENEFTSFEHKPRELTCIIGNTEKYWSGFDCGEQFIKYVCSIKGHKEIHLIAHNAGFDFNFIAKYLNDLEICKIGNRFIYALSRSKNSNIYVKDSMAFIASPLRDFSKIFALEDSKGEFKHEWIDFKNLDSNGQFINEWLDLEKDHKIPEQFIKENKFNVKEYSKYYNILDVKVLKQGYDKFGKWSKELGIDIDKIYTVSSLAKKYAENKGCFKGCYELSSIPQAFISQAIMGGRVMTQENKMILKEDTKIATLDANSLYPSAMISMKGFLKGRPKVIYPEDLNQEFLNKQDYYYVDVEILKVGKKLKMPILAEREEFSINYNNDMIGKTITVGKIYLEDLIKFQKIEYKLIRGYYFNEGFNDKIKEVIKTLYTTRNKLKAEKNPAEMIYKLIMNSIYGKCLQKPRDKKIVIKNNEKDMLKYIVRNSTNIECAEQMAGCDKWIIRQYKEINDDFNYVHIGGHILDQSKRIMNEVITLSEDLDVDIYYTDTDSMHLDLDKIKVVEKEYKNIYGKELINNDLLGFKQDFGTDKQGNEKYATKAVFIGKKTYIDILNDGSAKVKAKGITQKALYYNGTDEPRTNDELFEIYKNRKITEKPQVFDLTCGGRAFTAKQNSNYTFVSINNFTRTF